MSINEVIKKHLPVADKKLSPANKQYNYCWATNYHNCPECKEVKLRNCCKKLDYQAAKQVGSKRWHLYFLCADSHLVIRWVAVEGDTVLAGKIKN